MKKYVIILLCTVMLCFCACQPNPDKPPVISGNNGQMNEAINATPVPEDHIYEDPKRKTDEFFCLDQKVTITVDADIVKPKTNVFPVYRAEGNPIPDGFLRGIAEGVHPGVEFTQHRGMPALDQLEAQLEKYLDFIADWDSLVKYYLDQGLSQEEAEETALEVKEDYEKNRIPELQQLIKEARENPDYSAPIPADFMLRPFSYFDASQAWRDDQLRMTIAFGNDESGKRIRLTESHYLDELDHSVVSSGVRYTYGNLFWGDGEMVWKPLTYTEAEAREIAERFVKNSGLDDYVLYRATPRYNDKDGNGWWLRTEKEDELVAYHFYFCKSVSGVPIVKSGIVNDYARVQDDAHLTVIVTNEGVSFACMQNWWELGNIENENVSLLSFEEAYECFKRQAMVEYSVAGYDPISHVSSEHITIKRIQLVYCAIQSVGGGYTVVPAWMFCGTSTVNGEQETMWTQYNDDMFDAERFMIINAIDGSRISGRSDNAWGDDISFF